MQKIKYIFFSALILFTVTLYPQAINASLGFCDEPGIQRLFKLLGYAIYILKIAIPILLIVYGVIGFGKAVVSSDQDAVKKNLSLLAKKVIAGIVIFLVPTLFFYAFNVVQQTINNNSKDYNNIPKFTKCVNCMSKPNQCNP